MEFESFALRDSVSTMTEAANEVQSKLQSKCLFIVEEIKDFVDENSSDMFYIVEDIDVCCDRAEKHRSELRSVYKELDRLNLEENESKTYSVAFETTIEDVKRYIVSAKEKRSTLWARECERQTQIISLEHKKHRDEVLQKSHAAEFLIEEVSRLINEYLRVFTKVNNDDVNDDEISIRNDALKADMSKLDHLSVKFQYMLLIPVEYNNGKLIIVEIKGRYGSLITKKCIYEGALKLQVQKRELMKEKLFQVSALNIKLQIYKGYNSEMDIYSFQMEFEKLYSKSTPKKMLPDLLKHNYLADPALTLVKSVESIEEIWVRLKRAYGDPKTMLDKKLADVRRIGPLWKLKDSNRLIEGFASITNAMTDLIKLAKRHKVDGRLYNGDGLDIIYGMLGERRVTRWLGDVYDKELVADGICNMNNLEGEYLWKKLIKFL
ncbi:MAG: hypothetical protein MK200_08365 [Nitrosopumilus sp.]|nr:hypothetical protein [Nitrosopumilus sp.]